MLQSIKSFLRDVYYLLCGYKRYVCASRLGLHLHFDGVPDKIQYREVCWVDVDHATFIGRGSILIEGATDESPADVRTGFQRLVTLGVLVPYPLFRQLKWLGYKPQPAMSWPLKAETSQTVAVDFNLTEKPIDGFTEEMILNLFNLENAETPQPEPTEKVLVVDAPQPNLSLLSGSDLMRVPLRELRRYAVHDLKLTGSTRLLGGKAALVDRIIKSPAHNRKLVSQVYLCQKEVGKEG